MSSLPVRLLGILTLTLLVAACQDAPADPVEGDAVSSAVSSFASSVAVSSSGSLSSVPPVSGEMRVIEITAENWKFTPALITVRKGEKVTLKIVGKEGVHGFAVPELGINIAVSAGETVTVTLPTDTAGVFDAFCSIPCGDGHMDMKAKIVIEE